MSVRRYKAFTILNTCEEEEEEEEKKVRIKFRILRSKKMTGLIN